MANRSPDGVLPAKKMECYLETVQGKLVLMLARLKRTP
jgi:hypothetical protein